MPIVETDWEAENDAWSLLQAQQIKDDPDRMARAQAKLDKLAEDKASEASAARRAKTGRSSPQRLNDTSKPRTSRSQPVSVPLPGVPSGGTGPNTDMWGKPK